MKNTDSNSNSNENENKPLSSKNTNQNIPLILDPNVKYLKQDMLLFKDEILKDLRKTEEKLTVKISEQKEEIVLNNETNKQTIDTLLSKISHLTNLVSKNKILYDKIKVYDSFKAKTEEMLLNVNTKVNIMKREALDSNYKYETLLKENIFAPGLIGVNCKFQNIPAFVEYNLKNLKLINDYKEEVESFTNNFNDFKKQINTTLKNIQIEVSDNYWNFKRLIEENTQRINTIESSIGKMNEVFNETTEKTEKKINDFYTEYIEKYKNQKKDVEKIKRIIKSGVQKRDLPLESGKTYNSINDNILLNKKKTDDFNDKKNNYLKPKSNYHNKFKEFFSESTNSYNDNNNHNTLEVDKKYSSDKNLIYVKCPNCGRSNVDDNDKNRIGEIKDKTKKEGLNQDLDSSNNNDNRIKNFNDTYIKNPNYNYPQSLSTRKGIFYNTKTININNNKTFLNKEQNYIGNRAQRNEYLIQEGKEAFKKVIFLNNYSITNIPKIEFKKIILPEQLVVNNSNIDYCNQTSLSDSNCGYKTVKNNPFRGKNKNNYIGQMPKNDINNKNNQSYNNIFAKINEKYSINQKKSYTKIDAKKLKKGKLMNKNINLNSKDSKLDSLKLINYLNKDSTLNSVDSLKNISQKNLSKRKNAKNGNNIKYGISISDRLKQTNQKFFRSYNIIHKYDVLNNKLKKE